jgi:hypothetical protein
MVLYNLYLVLKDETVVVYDNATQSIVYVGSSENIPRELMHEIVRDVTIGHDRRINGAYFLTHLN